MQAGAGSKAAADHNVLPELYCTFDKRSCRKILREQNRMRMENDRKEEKSF